MAGETCCKYLKHVYSVGIQSISNIKWEYHNIVILCTFFVFQFLETMTDLILKGIQEAEKGIEKDTENKLYEEVSILFKANF